LPSGKTAEHLAGVYRIILQRLNYIGIRFKPVRDHIRKYSEVELMNSKRKTKSQMQVTLKKALDLRCTSRLGVSLGHGVSEQHETRHRMESLIAFAHSRAGSTREH